MTKQKRKKSTPASSTPLDRLAAWFGQDANEVDVIILAILAVLTFAVFANVLNGAFVYDDTRQILQNPVVRNSDQFWSALTTDVWAFKSGGTEVVSDYWRPFFVLWLVINERLFGLESTAGWHIANVVLHIGTAVLAYIVLRQLKISRPITTAIVLVFLLHPVHVETVSWISGSPDLLLALPILGAFSLLLAHQKTAGNKQYVAALFLFALALLAKESAVLFPLLVFIFHLLWTSEKPQINFKRIMEAGKYALPFVIIALLYLGARIAILGHITAGRPWYQPLTHIFLTIPSITAFYLRQPIFPLEIGPSYPLRIINPDTVSFQNFWLPLLLIILSVVVLLWLVRRSAVKQIGLTLFFLFLLPSFNINAFHPEQIVHDRYLYLPLLGFLIIAILSLNGAFKKLANRFSWQEDWQPLQFGVMTLLVTAVLTIPLSIQTIRYNTAWNSELSLWEWGVKTDPTSMLNTYLYGYHLFRDGQPETAEKAMDTVIENQPLTGPYYTYLRAIEAHLERADIASSQGKIQEARADLELVIAHSPTNISDEGRENFNAQQQRAYERLALSYMQQEEFETAVQTLENARQRLPQLSCTFTTNLAITLYLSGQKDKALSELEAVQDRIQKEFTPLCKMSLFYLGQLYLEFGQPAKARESLRQFLTASDTYYDAQTTNLQTQARQILNQISDQ